MYGLRKAFTIGFGASEQPNFAITERLLSKSKSAFESPTLRSYMETRLQY